MAKPTCQPHNMRLRYLCTEEISDPYRVIGELFDFADPDDIREILWEWLKTTVTGGFRKDLGRDERNAVLTLYEKLQKLVEAAYVLQSQKAAEDH